MKTQKLFDAYARHVWPIHRKFVRCLSKRCSRCITSEKEETLVDGLCPKCIAGTDVAIETPSVDDAAVSALETELTYAISDKMYDATLMLSGGKDSAYILHRLSVILPDLEVLCIFVNNGFSSPVAIENAKQTADKCGADLLIVNSFVQDFKCVLRRAFLDLNGRGASGIIDFIDGSRIFKVGEQITKGMNIPILIGGLSWFQVEHIIGIADYKQTKDSGQRHIFPLHAWRVPEQDIKKYVIDRGLISAGNDSPIVTNSDLILAMSVVDIHNLGYSSFENEFATMVRTGTADRTFWLHLFELLEYGTKKGHLDKDLDKVLSKLDLVLGDIVR